MACKGICHRHKAARHRSKAYYGTGAKRCQHCDIFIKWEGYHCPCCGMKLRSKPRSGELKQRMMVKTTATN